MARAVGSALRRLERIKTEYGGHHAREKRALLVELGRRRLRTAEQVRRFHEVLCFQRAYPDDRATLSAVERELRRFERRADLRRHRDALADTGIAGTSIGYSFYWETARWMAERWPDHLEVEWDGFENGARLASFLYLLLPWTETLLLDAFDKKPRDWIASVKPRRQSGAAFVARRFARLEVGGLAREMLYDDLEIPLRLHAGRRTPSRTLARRSRRVVFQKRPLDRARPDLRAAAERPPRSIRDVSAREAGRLVDLARGAMITRARDLDAFANADPRDVRLIDCGGGLEMACFGQRPDRRLMLESLYGFLTLKNGVPIGYALASVLFGSCEVAYNVFETFRGAEAAPILGHYLGAFRTLFPSVDTFSIDPFQLGHGNAEGLGSGAWWFYYKLGFRPRDPGVRRVLNRELRRMQRDPAHRSSEATLRRLVVAHVFLPLGRERADVLGRLNPGAVGRRVSRALADRFGDDRERGLETCAREARKRLGVRSLSGFAPDERRAFELWGPVLALVPGLGRWSPEERRGVVRVLRAKGGRREADYARLFDEHRRLRSALAALARPGGRR